MEREEPILSVRRSWWNYSGYMLFSWLLVPVAIAYWHKLSQRVEVYNDRVVLQRGILTTDVRIIFIEDIRSIDIRQSMMQRLCRYGDIMISSAGTAGIEYVATGIPEPAHVKDVILDQRSRSQFYA